MNKKNFFLKFGLMVSVISLMGVAFTSATSFTFNIRGSESKISSISKNITPIHFADNWNDFWGFIYLSETESSGGNYYRISGTILENEEVEYECQRKVRWFYYNAERWEILWPLDENTWTALRQENANLIISWWIYTLCRNAWYHEALADCENFEVPEWDDTRDVEGCVNDVDAEYPVDDDYAYYWKVIRRSSDNIPRVLTIGMGYSKSNPWVTPNSKLDKTFVRFENKIPVGFVYDDNWWIWFAWCRIVENNNNKWNIIRGIIDDLQLTWMQDLFEYSGGDNKVLAYTGDSGIRNNIDCNMIWTAEDSLVNLLIEWLVWLNRESTLWIQKNQSSNKMQYFVSANINNSTMINYAKRRSEILCRWKWNKDDGNVVCLDNSNSNNIVDARPYTGKTLIVKNRDVLITPDNNDSSYYDIFVNSWNLIINDNDNPTAVFNNQWFYDPTTSLNAFKNTIAGEVEWNVAGFSAGSFFKWNFIIDWNIQRNDGKPIEHKYFIYWKLTSKDTVEKLENLFAWRCRDWIWTDGTPCPEGTYAYASLVVINQNYDSPLMQ